MSFGLEGDTLVDIPWDLSWYVIWMLCVVVCLLSLKITYRYVMSFRAEYEMHATTKKNKPSSKKKRF